jgi:PIN like domain
MAAKSSKSKKQSDASFRPKQPDDAPILFLDRCLGRIVIAEALRAVGEHVRVHHEYFEQDARDADWLGPVGRNGWVVLTKDRHIRSNQIEIESLIGANIACFNLVSADMDGTQMARAFVAALRDMKRMLQRINRPFVANVTKSGRIDLLYRYADLAKRLK